MKIIEIIREVVAEFTLGKEFAVEHPADEKMGDFSTNAAMVLAKELGRNPRELAVDLVGKLEGNKKLRELVEKIEPAGPGFINFWVKDEVLIKKIDEALAAKEKLGDSDFMKGKKVLVEYSSPNIAKRFSVGHLRSTIIGQAIFNLYKHSGAEVTNDNHLGDWGTQFGMIIAAIEEDENFDWNSADINKLEEIYVDFNKRMEEDPELRTKAKEAFLRLEKGDASARSIWQKSVDISMKEFDEIYKKLNVDFENTLGESEYESLMPEIIEEAKNKKIASVGEEGALIVEFLDERGKEQMPPAMLVKSDGSTTYFTRDLATVKMRLSNPELKSDVYVYEVGGEQRLHLKQVFVTANKLWPEETRIVQFVHVAHGRMTNEGQAMSTRKGNTIKLEDLLGRSKNESIGKMINVKSFDGEEEMVETEKVFKGMKMSEVQDISEKISIGAVKYNDLKRSPGMDYDFRWDEAMSMDGNSAPYLQYVYVRTRGILNKSGEKIDKVMSDNKEFTNDDERNLARWLLLRFAEGEVVESAAKNFAPQQLCAYLFETAQKFNGFYERNKVIGVKNQSLRLSLTLLVGEVIKKGLEIIGIETVEKM
ncbi:MAG: Arginine-tRNA ligase [candidate division WWE3 bacterium GW2011_GWB1_42_6]|uniref:Arginine--tRNA ligase n=1 Tax=candidate division WWE3 bacterium GW2011_GWB1_42_6 TaxID=1619115 RepID=A0A0G1D6H3_UNCKA|nr:MAG: Arginine-tRNA ligase [candidate division WWE3 bacterium GW2011_GWB1_42_6]